MCQGQNFVALLWEGFGNEILTEDDYRNGEENGQFGYIFGPSKGCQLNPEGW